MIIAIVEVLVCRENDREQCSLSLVSKTLQDTFIIALPSDIEDVALFVRVYCDAIVQSELSR